MVGNRSLSPIWLSTDPNIVRRIQQKYGKEFAALAHSWRGIWHIARAQAIVISHGMTDLPWLHLNRKALLFQAFHGLPTKGDGQGCAKPSLAHRFRLWRHWKPVDRFLSSSPLVSDIYARRYRLPVSCFLELGYPSHDAMIHAATTPDDVRALFPDAPPWKHILLYTPTFRKQTVTQLFPFDDFDPETLRRFLDENDVLCCLRPHPNEKLNLDPWLAISPRIVALDDKIVPDLYTVLPHCSLVVTDYSAVYIEGLLADIPSIFVPYDLETYERGLAFDYNEMTPGAKVSSLAAMVMEATAALNAQRKYASDQDRVRKMFFTHIDGHATERVTQWLCEQIGKRQS